MIGFGFMDNMVMLNVGDAIDSTLGVTFGLSVLVAAGVGQMASDTAGVCFGGTVEALASKLGLPSAGLSAEQLELKETKVITTIGMALGVLLGCALGMCSLLFMDLEKNERLKREKEMDEIFSTVMEAGGVQLNAERCTLFVLDRESKTLWSKVSEGDDKGKLTEIISLPMGSGIAGWVAKHKEIAKIDDAYNDPRFNNATDIKTGYKTQSVLCAPVHECCGPKGLRGTGRVMAVVQAINKKDGGTFTRDDLVAMDTIVTHVAVFMRHMDHSRSILTEDEP